MFDIICFCILYAFQNVKFQIFSLTYFSDTFDTAWNVLSYFDDNVSFAMNSLLMLFTGWNFYSLVTLTAA